jgi:hypothetical protein
MKLLSLKRIKNYYEGVIEWQLELIPVINPDTGEVEYVHHDGECLLKSLIKHMLKIEEEQ